MKKILLSAIAALGAMAADAQVTTVDKNYAFYLTKDTVGVSLGDEDLAKAYEKTGIAYKSGGNAGQAVKVCLSKDYLDEETGVKFSQGYYASKRQNNMEYYYVKNCKQIIIYSLSGGQTQAYAAENAGALGDETTGTGIRDVENTEAARVAPKKILKNGQIMVGDFNIAGQRVK